MVATLPLLLDSAASHRIAPATSPTTCSSATPPCARASAAASSGLAPGDYVAHVRIEAPDAPADVAVLEVKLRVGAASSVAVAGAGCAIRDGRVHVERGSTCVLATPGVGVGAAAPGVQWKLPGGALVSGAALYGQFTRAGEYQVEVSAVEDGADTLTVVVE